MGKGPEVFYFAKIYGLLVMDSILHEDRVFLIKFGGAVLLHKKTSGPFGRGMGEC